MNSGRTNKFRGIDSPKVIFPVIGLLALTSLAKVFGIQGIGIFAGIFMGVIVSFIIRHIFEDKDHD